MKGQSGLLHGVKILALALILPVLISQRSITPQAHAIIFGTPAEFQQDVVIQGSLIVASGASILSDKLHFNEPVIFLDELLAKVEAIFENTVRLLGAVFFEGPVTHQSTTSFEGNVILPKNTAGIATVSAFSTRTTVPFSQPFDSIPIVTLTPRLRNTSRRTIILSSGVTAYVTNTTLSDFTILLNRNALVPLEYNWMAVVTGE
jgi:hypothetical protein